MTYSIAYRRILNKMGYYNYQNGLIYRHLNQSGGWDTHLEHCRRFILKALDFYKPEKVTVLGSGWLLELPIAEMIERINKVCLVDIVHPPDVISQTRNFKNVELVELDVTGGLIEEVWKNAGGYFYINRLKSLRNIAIPEYLPDSDPGIVISLNILTQLESLLVDFLKKRSKINEEEFSFFRSEIQRKHIDFLKKYRSILISDIAEVITNKSGSITTIPTLATDLPSGQNKEEWTWNFDQTGADFYNSRSILKVVALTI
ncbi:MAG TPA: hypothetical protein VMV77_16995 [Bacteroidales bacterium]|nr:hypothetical protein [Bacteroidales bacterium]